LRIFDWPLDGSSNYLDVYQAFDQTKHALVLGFLRVHFLLNKILSKFRMAGIAQDVRGTKFQLIGLMTLGGMSDVWFTAALVGKSIFRLEMHVGTGFGTTIGEVLSKKSSQYSCQVSV
jgi:hypothetical protein